jgi:hypothetical protein
MWQNAIDPTRLASISDHLSLCSILLSSLHLACASAVNMKATQPSEMLLNILLSYLVSHPRRQLASLVISKYKQYHIFNSAVMIPYVTGM